MLDKYLIFIVVHTASIILKEHAFVIQPSCSLNHLLNSYQILTLEGPLAVPNPHEETNAEKSREKHVLH